MNRTDKINHCFQKLVPESLILMHEIHYLQAVDLDKTTNALRTFIRKRVNEKNPIDINEDEFLELVTDAVSEMKEYFDLIALFEGIKKKIPVDVIMVAAKEGVTSDLHKKAFDEFKKAIIYVSSMKDCEEIDEIEMSESIRTVCNFIASSDSSIHHLDGEAQG